MPTPSRTDRPARTLCTVGTRRLATWLVATALAAAGLGAQAADLADALAHPDRPPADLTRDARSKPAAVLALADLQPGDVALDVFAGGGYYSEILARTVGPEGKVYLYNNGAYAGFAGEAIDQRLAGGRLPNVERLELETDEFELPEGSVDLALAVMSWHDLYWVDENWPRIDPDDFARRVLAALAPGGTLLIVDHSAETGTGSASVNALHRIEEAWLYRALTDVGFRLTGQSQALRNGEDDRRLGVFDEAIRGRTDRFVLRFTAP